MTRPQPVHPCPGCGMDSIPNRMLACVVCWSDMPAELKTDLMRSYRERREDPVEYRTVRAECLTWLRTKKVALCSTDDGVA